MKAHATDQWRLLDVQALDTRLAQLEHRRRNLPEAVRLLQAQERRQGVQTDLVLAQTELGDVEREVGKAEDDVTLVRDRAARNRQRLDAGTGPAKELQALQHELASLERRQADLEEVQLGVMERVEDLTERVGMLERARVAADADLATATTAHEQALAAIAREAEQVTAERAMTVPGLDRELVALYEKIRAQSGVGAAALRERRCEGCRLELTGADLARIAAADPDEVLRCEECRRILVRTAESGV